MKISHVDDVGGWVEMAFSKEIKIEFSILEMGIETGDGEGFQL